MAITISFLTEGEKLIPTSKPVIASGDRDTVTISVAFDSSWDGYAKSGVFMKKCDKDHNVYEAIMDSNNSCIIPHEALDEAGTTYIGIRGVNGASVYTSSLVAYRIDPGAPEGTTATVPPTASVYQQLLTANAVLSSRVDQIASLPAGGTSGDAELRDIRVKADGTTASTAGNAVREQVSQLSESISEIKDDFDTLEIDVVLNKGNIDILQDSLHYKMDKPTYGDEGKIPRAKEGREVEWVSIGQPTYEQTETAVNMWLDAHPEATTTVDFRTTYKVLSNVQAMIDDLTLKENDNVRLLGHYNPHDGGSAYYIVSNSIDVNKLSIELSNGLYAILCEENGIINLLCYDGISLHEIFDNAKQYMVKHRWKKIILPPPNKNHPASFTWTSEGKEKYCWSTDEPILIDETFAYSTIELNGDIVANKNIEAVVKVSDLSKPEDIYFVGDVVLSGKHHDFIETRPTFGLLIEGGARINFQTFHAGFCENCIGLGGNNANNTIDIYMEYCEIGSFSKNAIYARNTRNTQFKSNVVVIQKPLVGHGIRLINAEGEMYNWYIGSLSFSAAGQTITDLEGIYFNTNLTQKDSALNINQARIGGSTFMTLLKGLYTFGQLVLAGTSNGARTIDVGANTVCVVNSARVLNDNWNVRTDDVRTSSFYAQYSYPTPINEGRNISINGIANFVTAEGLINGVSIDDNAKIISFVKNGVIINGYTLRNV